MGVELIAVIDLGEVPAGHRSDDVPARPRTHHRWAVAALTLGMALSTAGASGPLPRPLPMVILNAPGDVRVSVDGDTLFVVQPFALSQGRGEGRYVAAYRLMDLTQLWRVELPLGGDVAGLTTVGGVLVLTGEPVGAGTPTVPADEDTGEGSDALVGRDAVGLDVATGKLLWRHKGSVEGSTPGGRLILAAERRGGGVPANPGPGGGGQTLRAVASTGKVVWSYTPPPGAQRSYRFDGPAATLLAVVLPGGDVELRDTDTGELLRSRQIGPQPKDRAIRRYLEVVGDLLLVRDEAEVVAYGLDRLDLRWRLPLEPGQDGWFTSCGGGALCVMHQGQRLTVIDPGTGRVRWSDPRWTEGFAWGGRLMATDYDPLHGDRTVAVVDPYSGRVQRDLGTWHALEFAGGSVVGLRFVFTHTLVAFLDPVRGPRVVGVVPDVIGPSCVAQRGFLWCRRTDNTLGVWRLPG